MPSVKHIFCHPVKGVGRVALETSGLIKGQTMPGDRVFAITHKVSKFDAVAAKWVSCNNFIRGAKAPELQAISISKYDPDAAMVLRHPDHPPFRFNPNDITEHAAFINWVAQFVPDNRAQPAALVSVDRGMTDSNFASISVLNMASLAALSEQAGRPMAPERFRGNIWLEGMNPWEERDWIGKTLRIGTAHVIMREHIGRCRATTVDPQTGIQDVNTLGILEKNWGHTDFGIYAEVIKSGDLDLHDKAEIL